MTTATEEWRRVENRPLPNERPGLEPDFRDHLAYGTVDGRRGWSDGHILLIAESAEDPYPPEVQARIDKSATRLYQVRDMGAAMERVVPAKHIRIEPIGFSIVKFNFGTPNTECVWFDNGLCVQARYHDMLAGEGTTWWCAEGESATQAIRAERDGKVVGVVMNIRPEYVPGWVRDRTTG